MNSLFEKIGTVCVPVKDVQKSADWYTEKLGMRVCRKDEAQAELEVCGGETVLILKAAEPFNPVNYLHRKGMVTHFNFNTLDAELAHLMLKDKEVGVTDVLDADFLKCFAFRDLDGNVLSVCYEKEHSMFYQPITETSISLFERIEAVFILVRDLRNTLDWYLHLPGLELLNDWKQGADLKVGNGETIVTLIQVDDFTPRQNSYFEFTTANMKKTHSYLKKMGASVSEIDSTPQETSCRVQDPEGNIFGVRRRKVAAPTL
ncbi:MAG TPA: VOC family protein [Bacillales bacterium]|nr:VOC family protein [Bacillales bacterium]